LKFLNKWGCRQFAKNYHADASREIADWYQQFGGDLCPKSETLLSLTDLHLGGVERAYSGLVSRTASRRGQATVTVGPAGTAKILFALRPNSFIPWDDPIRGRFGWDGSASSYRKHLVMAKGWLNELSNKCAEKGFELGDLPSKLGRPQSSIAKLIDEYLWVTVTSRCVAPGKVILEQWAEWS